MTRVLVTGADGMLGWDLQQQLSGRADLVALSRKQLDLTSPDSVRAVLDREQPAVVINAAAYTNVDGAETERDRALAVNGTAVADLVVACRERRIGLIHFGTDQVFDGQGKTPRTEDETPHPVNYYAQSKWIGEEAALGYPQALVLRVQWLYGQKKDRFSPLRQKAKFTPFSDQFGAPTWTREVARFAWELWEKKARGLFHLAYDDYAAWADVFAFVRDEWKLKLELVPTLTYDMKLPAARPRFSVLSNRKIVAVLGRPMGGWRTPLREFLRLL